MQGGKIYNRGSSQIQCFLKKKQRNKGVKISFPYSSMSKGISGSGTTHVAVINIVVPEHFLSASLGIHVGHYELIG